MVKKFNQQKLKSNLCIQRYDETYNGAAKEDLLFFIFFLVGGCGHFDKTTGVPQSIFFQEIVLKNIDRWCETNVNCFHGNKAVVK